MSLFNSFFSQQIVAINAKSALTINTEGNSKIKNKCSIKKKKPHPTQISVILITTTAAVPKKHETIPPLLLLNTA